MPLRIVLAEVDVTRPAIGTFFFVVPAKDEVVNVETDNAMIVNTVMEIVFVLSNVFIDFPLTGCRHPPFGHIRKL